MTPEALALCADALTLALWLAAPVAVAAALGGLLAITDRRYRFALKSKAAKHTAPPVPPVPAKARLAVGAKRP